LILQLKPAVVAEMFSATRRELKVAGIVINV